jgi:energy-coupling factor transporter ATP-binding protein EcfA2
MDVFKVRKIRETGSTSIGTLDSVHQDIVQTLRESKLKKDELEEEIQTLKPRVDALKGSNEIADVLQCSKWEARIHEVESELSRLNPVQDYYMKNMDILMEYYNRGDGAATVPAATPKDANTFLKFFAGAAPEGSSRKQMFDEYVARMKLTNNPEVLQQQTEHCMGCNVAREEISSEGILVCPKCGSEEYALVVSDFQSFRDPPKERNNYAYKKINHLNEILNQFQAKESTIIPDEVMNEVVLEIRKRRISNIADLTEKEIREILKKLGRSKYYEHAAHILSRLNGNPPPTITPEIEEKIRAMFQEIQAPFLLYCPNDRTNFLSYSYILYKFFELLDLDEYKVYFPLLKSRDRLIAHDQIWAKICDYLKWEFIRSV